MPAALGLVLNAVVLWNTRYLYLDAIVEHLRGSGAPVHDEDVARLSRLGHAHLARHPACRRTIRHRLSRVERRNFLARAVFHGQGGQLRQTFHYRSPSSPSARC